MCACRQRYYAVVMGFIHFGHLLTEMYIESIRGHSIGKADHARLNIRQVSSSLKGTKMNVKFP